jgi:CheY-like chemotaxis protein
MMLEAGGHKVMCAGDGAAGYGTYLLFRPDLVITDIEMPEKSGLEMTARIRMRNPGMAVIYMSADPERFRLRLEEEKKRYQVGLLQKPFSRRELMRLVSEHGCKGERRKEENG